MKQNYDLLLKKTIAENERLGIRPRLLLHVCCAPCSSYVLEYISSKFDITLYYHNPNITPAEEFSFRLAELERFNRDAGYNLNINVPEYDPREFFDAVRGMEDLPEGSERCRVCYELRLRRTAEEAARGGYDYFTTTLSISPYKRADWLNEIGTALGEEYRVKYLFSDFKKCGGYKRSIEMSREYNLYRQDYCGCIFSKVEAEKRRNISAAGKTSPKNAE